MQKFLMIALVLSLAACGGRDRGNRYTGGAATGIPVASGPMADACMKSDRKARSRALCGCIQAVANRHLSARERRLATSFWSDPQRAQDMRQSDVAQHEAFWKKYREFGNRVEGVCKPARG